RLRTMLRCRVYLFLLFRSPPSPTLFPYTTLFRSGLRTEGEHSHRVDRVRGGHVELRRPDRGGRALGGRRRCGRHQHVPHPKHARDRKSTRLNSSHVKISYAVFCLKKKTTTTCERH